MIPVNNGSSTLSHTLKSLCKQQPSPEKIIIINDNSKDGSEKIINKYQRKFSRKIVVFTNKKAFGLAHNYNLAISLCHTPILITIHQDILLNINTISKLLTPFNNPEIVASHHVNYLPKKIWKGFNFWQKAYFDRHLGRHLAGLNCQCDAFRINALKQVGGFDEIHFKSAGEDGDIIKKLRNIGIIASTTATVIHLHQLNNNFSVKDFLGKHRQYAQAQGTLLIIHGTSSIKDAVLTHLREILAISIFIPKLNMIFIPIVIFFCFAYTIHTYIHEAKNPRVFILPFVNFISLFISLIGTIEGILYHHQTYDLNSTNS